MTSSNEFSVTHKLAYICYGIMNKGEMRDGICNSKCENKEIPKT